jgi:hypothetical protein
MCGILNKKSFVEKTVTNFEEAYKQKYNESKNFKFRTRWQCI